MVLVNHIVPHRQIRNSQSLIWTEELKLKLKNQLSPVIITDTQEVEIPKTVEIVDE